MADEHVTEPGPGTPGQRALGAMESAVRRARASAGAAPLPLPPPPPPRGRHPARPVGPPPPPTAGDQRSAGPDRWLIGSVAVVAALVVAAAVALIVSLSGSSPPLPATAARSVATTTVAHSPSTASHAGTSPTTAPTPSTTPTSIPTSAPPTVAVAPAGPPVISSLSPSSGTAGQTITVAGANFLSSSGQIVATFNGQVTATSCPAQSTCTVTAPALSAPSAQVVITTAGGASNAMTFTYG